jgi:hypothetical protein
MDKVGQNNTKFDKVEQSWTKLDTILDKKDANET